MSAWRVSVCCGEQSSSRPAGKHGQTLITKHTAYFRPKLLSCCQKDIRTASCGISSLMVLSLSFAGNSYCASRREAMDDFIRVAHSTPGDGQNRSSLMHDMVGPQDTFNDFTGTNRKRFSTTASLMSTWMQTPWMQWHEKKDAQSREQGRRSCLLGKEIDRSEGSIRAECRGSANADPSAQHTVRLVGPDDCRHVRQPRR